MKGLFFDNPHTIRSLASTVALVVAIFPLGLFAQDTRKEEAVIPGFADSDVTGSLPAFTTELSKRAANAISKRDWKTARKLYLKMLGSEPKNPLTLSNLGAVEYQMGKISEAREHLEGAVRQRPKLAATWLTLGLIYYQEKKLHLALAAMSHAVHERPKDPRARNYFGVIVKALGWADAAESELQKSIELNPNYAEAHFNLAVMYLERRPPALALARRHYDKSQALGAAPDKLVERQLKEEEEEAK
jgi:tetratricopeptide (TPR) repeat protein